MRSDAWASRVKKTVSYKEKSEALRSEFIETIGTYPPERLYYVDECGLDKYLYREYGYSPRGTPVIGSVSGKKFKRINLVAAKCGSAIIAPMVYDGTTDSVLFECWFENALLKVLPPHSVIILDNATFHRKARLRSLAEQAMCAVIFLPPYSPDLNPIERFWAWIKSRLRSILPFYSDFDSAVADCFQFK
jgi:transposase